MERREGGEGRRVLLQQRQSIPPSLHLGRHTRTPSVSQFSHHQQHLHSLFFNPSSTIHHQLSTLPMSRSYRLQTDRSTHTQARPVKKKGQRAVSADLLCSRAARMYVRPSSPRAYMYKRSSGQAGGRADMYARNRADTSIGWDWQHLYRERLGGLNWRGRCM
ncbi:uncharacterized protein BKA78DRAFT_63007 [Phyllosticta capitalensis]|uniref:uncharacterized protein n=1 Tax=Phyllosticta capitalensis TaxID=121624 RepID=UPI0031305869